MTHCGALFFWNGTDFALMPESLRFCARLMTRHGTARTGVLFSDDEEFVRIGSSFRSLIVLSIYYCSISDPGVGYTPYAGLD